MKTLPTKPTPIPVQDNSEEEGTVINRLSVDGGAMTMVINDSGVTINGKPITTSSSHIVIRNSGSDTKGERTVTNELPIGSIRTVNVRTDYGRITAEPSADSDRIEVAATVTFNDHSLSKADLERYLRGFTISDAVDGDIYNVRVVPPADLPKEIRWVVSYRVSVPPSVALDLQTENGAVAVRNTHTKGNVLARSKYGAISVINAGNTVEAESDNGAVMIQGKENRDSVSARSDYGAISITGPAKTIDAKTENGAVEIIGAPNAEKVTARTSYGAINLEKIGGEVDAQTENGAVHYSGIPAKLVLKSEYGGVTADLGDCTTLTEAELTTHNGAVTVNLDSSASVTLSGHTSNGNIMTDGFTAQITGDSYNKSFTATRNGGRAPIKLSTEYGRLSVTTN